MKKILVTGGAGYIGSHTVVELATAGYEPVILDNFSNSKPFIVDHIAKILGRKVRLYTVDCIDAAGVADVFQKEGKIDGVIHFAALKSVSESVAKPLEYYRVNLTGLLTLLGAADKAGVADFVFSSSCTVYGIPDELPVTENTPLKAAASPYGNTKTISEQILRDAVASKVPLKVVALRYFNPIGAHSSALIGELPLGVPQNLVPFMTQTAAGLREKLTVYGNDYATPDGTCIRDYIHVVDLARAHVSALRLLEKRPQAAGSFDVFNIGTGRGYSVLELVQAFERVTGQKLNYVIGPRRPGDVEAIYANADKAAGELGWRAEQTIEEALQSAWAWENNIASGCRDL